ncbi:hypothetical protein ABMA27_009232 [Loxostege sticticalis]|uniref:Major facilitator superfamily (MFS) profile domain-containing protein n=1 Tax=Loxostege sticticalis TaxID=481309 RepID=A0ABR3HAD1_LOXSC
MARMHFFWAINALFLICLPCLNLGVMYVLPSSTLENFTSNKTMLHRPMTELEVGLYGSLSSAGAMVGTPIVAAILDKLGRKTCTVLVGLTSVISWAILACTGRVEIVLFAIFVGGLGGASFLIVPVYCSEFCQESIRGTMTAGSMVFYGIGMLVSYLLGDFCSYINMIYIALSLATGSVVSMIWLKESPTLLVQKGLNEKAAESISFYRQVSTRSKLVLEELDAIHRSLNPLESGMKKNCFQKKKILKLKVKKSQPTRRGLFITLITITLTTFQGIIAVQVYLEPLFQKAVPTMSSTLCCLLFAVTIVVASVLAAWMSDLAGRRPLIIYSSIGSCICCVVLGTQMQFEWGPSWLTAVVLYVFCAVFSFGGGTVPFVLFAEMFLPEVKSFMTMVVVEWMWICCFLILIVFNPLASLLGLGGVFHVFAGVCIATAVVSVIYVPETKGMTLDAVQVMLAERRNF